MNKQTQIKSNIWSWGDSLVGKVPAMQVQDYQGIFHIALDLAS